MRWMAWSILLAFGTISVQAADQPPNILLIVVDDLGCADLSCIGVSKDVHTPNIDRLAKTGVRFSRCYATAPICNASRIAIMTGCYQQRQGQYWYGGPGLHDPALPTLAERLKTKGYATGYFGKYHHGSSDSVSKRGFPMNHGFDTFYGFSGGTKHYLKHKKSNPKGPLAMGPMWDGKKQVDVEGFTTELFGERARRFIKANTAKPFYLHLAFNAVHNYTYQLPAKYLSEKGLKGFYDHDPKKEPYKKWREKIGYPAHPEGRAYYLGQLHFLDVEIGRVVDELREQKLLENTAIFFVSDNGGSRVTYAENTPLRGGKYTLYEGGTRVPMIACWPKRFKVGIKDRIVSTMDIYPTVCEIVGAPLPKVMDGGSLMSALTDDGTATGHDALFWDTGKQMAATMGKWKLLITKQAPNAFLQRTETPKGAFLYDLDADIGETKDVSAAHPEIMQKLKTQLAAWQKATCKQVSKNRTKKKRK